MPWINISKEQADAVSAAITSKTLGFVDDQSFLDKLNNLPHEGDPDKAFRDAVQKSNELEVDDDAVVSLGDSGGFVMSWSWVSNIDAGIEDDSDNDSDDYDDDYDDNANDGKNEIMNPVKTLGTSGCAQ